MGRSSVTKAEWLGALETAAKLGVEHSSAVWVWIMQELGLGTAILSGNPRGCPAGKMENGKKSPDLHKDGGKT